MRTIFYIVRHGETLFNVKGLIQGSSDSPLTEKGFYQAEKMHEVLKDVSFGLAVSSTSERARDTLLTIVQNSCPVQFYKDLKEIKFGDIEGDSVHKLVDSPSTDYRAYGGETFSQAKDRFEKRLILLSSQVGSQNVLVVSHGAVIQQVLHDLYPAYDTFMPNCSLTKIVCTDGQLSVLSLPEVLI